MGNQQGDGGDQTVRREYHSLLRISGVGSDDSVDAGRLMPRAGPFDPKPQPSRSTSRRLVGIHGPDPINELIHWSVLGATGDRLRKRHGRNHRLPAMLEEITQYGSELTVLVARSITLNRARPWGCSRRCGRSNPLGTTAGTLLHRVRSWIIDFELIEIRQKLSSPLVPFELVLQGRVHIGRKPSGSSCPSARSIADDSSVTEISVWPCGAPSSVRSDYRIFIL